MTRPGASCQRSPNAIRSRSIAEVHEVARPRSGWPRAVTASQSVRGRWQLHPAVAPAHDEVNPPDSGNRVAARGHLYPVGALEHGGPVPNLDNGPAGNGCRPRFRRRCQRWLRRHRHCGWTRIGLRRRTPRSLPWRRVSECCRQWRAPRFAGLTSDAVLRDAFRLAAGFAAAMEGEGASCCAIWSTPIRFATSGQCSAPAHPSAKLAASAIVASRKGRARAPYGSRSTSTSSRLRLRISGRPAGLPRQRPDVIRENRLAVLHGVTHGLVSR